METIEPGFTGGTYIDDLDHRIYARIRRLGKAYDSIVVSPGGGITPEYYDDVSKELTNRCFNVYDVEFLGSRTKYKKGISGFHSVIEATSKCIDKVRSETNGDVYGLGDSFGCFNIARNLDKLSKAALHGATDVEPCMSSLPLRVKADFGFKMIESTLFDNRISTLDFIKSLADKETRDFIENDLMKDEFLLKKYTTKVPMRAMTDMQKFSILPMLMTTSTPVLVMDSLYDKISGKIRDEMVAISEGNPAVTHKIVKDSSHLWLWKKPADCADMVSDFFRKG